MKILSRRRFVSIGFVSGAIAWLQACRGGDKTPRPKATTPTRSPATTREPETDSNPRPDRWVVATLDELPLGAKKEAAFADPNAFQGMIKIFLVRFNAEQAAEVGAVEGSILALSRKCPHLGCTVPFVPDFSFPHPRTDEPQAGWFRCPCHGATFDDAGLRVFGPAPRSMDLFRVYVEGGNVIVDLTQGVKGSESNAERAIMAEDQ